jgi:hypothetical protein
VSTIRLASSLLHSIGEDRSEIGSQQSHRLSCIQHASEEMRAHTRICIGTTFRVDWYVFPLLGQLNGHRIVVHVAAAIVVESVRAVLKIIGYELHKTRYY